MRRLVPNTESEHVGQLSWTLQRCERYHKILPIKDFVVWNPRKRAEKLRYMHRNPVKRGLVLEPQQWLWSSFRFYAYDEPGPVLVNEQRPAEMKLRSVG